MHVVVEHLIPGARRWRIDVTHAEIDGSAVIHQTLKQVVDAIEGDGVVVGAWPIGGRKRRRWQTLIAPL